MQKDLQLSEFCLKQSECLRKKFCSQRGCIPNMKLAVPPVGHPLRGLDGFSGAI
jgi:hypothetical protein